MFNKDPECKPDLLGKEKHAWHRHLQARYPSIALHRGHRGDVRCDVGTEGFVVAILAGQTDVGMKPSVTDEVDENHSSKEGRMTRPTAVVAGSAPMVPVDWKQKYIMAWQ